MRIITHIRFIGITQERSVFCMFTPMTEGDIEFALEVLEAAMNDLMPVIAAEAPELIK